MDMKVKPYLISSVARSFVAQRLVRRLCEHCKVESEMSPEQADALNRPDLTGVSVHVPTGCCYCANTGFDGRVGLFEMIHFDEELANRFAMQPEEAMVKEFLAQRKSRTLLDDGLEKIQAGKTTVEQVASVASYH